MPPHHAIPKLCARAVLSSALWFGACQGGANKVAYGVTASQFQDMVVPAGMRLRDGTNESYSRQEAGWRLGHFVYQFPPTENVARGCHANAIADFLLLPELIVVFRPSGLRRC